MADRRTLHLSATGLASHAPGASAAEAFFPSDAAGHTRFASYLRARAKTRFTILVDLPDELFATETLPPLRNRDRQRLLARRQERLGADTPYITHLPLNKSNSTTRDETILLAALTRPESLQSWLDVLVEAGAIVVGIHSIPFVGTALLGHLPAAVAPPGAPQLLATLGAAGLRVSCHVEGKLRFSRLTPVGAEPWAACRHELQRTSQYLHAQRILSRETPPLMRVIADKAQHDAIRGTTPDTLDCIDLDALSRHCGAPPSMGSDSLPLFIHLLSATPRVPTIDVPALAHTRRIMRVGRGAILGTALAVGASIVVGAANYIASEETEVINAQLRARITGAQLQLEQARAAIPPTPYPSPAIHAAHSRAVGLHAAADVEARLRAISRAFDQYPQIELDRLEWALSPQESAPALAMRLQITLPARGAGTLAETFAATLESVAQAKTNIEPVGSPASIPPAADTPPRESVVLRLSFTNPAP